MVWLSIALENTVAVFDSMDRNTSLSEIFVALGFSAGEARLCKIISALRSEDITTLVDFRGIQRFVY